MTRLILLSSGNMIQIKWIKHKQSRMPPTNKVKYQQHLLLVYNLQRSLLLAYTQFPTSDCVYKVSDSLISRSSPY